VITSRSSAFCVLLLLGCAGQGDLPPAQPEPQQSALIVRPQVGSYTYSDGFPAKSRAMQICAARGLVLDPAAFGQFAAGAWIFAGGCVKSRAS
jgi:hypothetical protein